MASSSASSPSSAEHKTIHDRMLTVGAMTDSIAVTMVAAAVTTTRYVCTLRKMIRIDGTYVLRTVARTSYPVLVCLK